MIQKSKSIIFVVSSIFLSPDMIVHPWRHGPHASARVRGDARVMTMLGCGGAIPSMLVVTGAYKVPSVLAVIFGFFSARRFLQIIIQFVGGGSATNATRIEVGFVVAQEYSC